MAVGDGKICVGGTLVGIGVGWGVQAFKESVVIMMKPITNDALENEDFFVNIAIPLCNRE